MNRSLHSLAFVTFAVLGTAVAAHAGDWPQILGPQRSGVAAADESLPGGWAKPPKVLWSYKLGQGYSGPAISGGRVVVFHRIGDKERVEALDAATGRRLWQADFPTTYRGTINPDSGPRAVPLIHQGRVYVYGAAGNLHCLSLQSGRTVWSRNALGDYRGPQGYFGAGSTPIAVGGNLLVNLGGRDAGIVAFDLATGKTRWKATDERASYSSPTLAEIDGQTKAVFVTRLHALSIDPQSGEVGFRREFGKRGPTVNAATPLVIDGHLFLTASYGVGAVYAKIDGAELKSVWANDRSLSSQYATPVHHEGFLYGNDGREDIGVASFRCLDLKTGRVAWQVEDFGVAHAIRAGDKLLICKINGEVILARANPKRFEKLGTAQIMDNTARAIPALSGGRLYWRDNTDGGGGTLKCVQVGE